VEAGMIFILILLVVLSSHLMADEPNSGVDPGDTAFILLCSALVLLMTPGLALFYGGLVRSKNAINTMMMSFIAMGIVGVQWVLWGYSLAFSPGSSIVGSLKWFALNEVGLEPNPDYSSTIPHQAFMIFQAMFAIITPALISGAVVERMRFRAYIIFILLWSTFVYDFVAHWVWGVDGWLRELGALDFAGGTVVHINAGVSALVSALALGSRRGFPQRPMPPHNVPMAILGAGLLWFGWFGFNAGSAIAAGMLATNAFVTTNTATASGVFTWALMEIIFKGKPTAVGVITGAVAGLVAITPACGFVNIFGAIAIGSIAAMMCYLSVSLRLKLKLDDSLDVFSVHGVGGIAGAILTGVFATTEVNPSGADGLLYGNPDQLLMQLTGVGATIGIAVVGTFVILAMLDFTIGIRVREGEEEEGLDLVEHGERAYHLEEVGGIGEFSEELKLVKPEAVKLKEKRRIFKTSKRKPPVELRHARREPPRSVEQLGGGTFRLKIENIDEKSFISWWREMCTGDWRALPQEFKDIYPNVKLFSDTEIIFSKGDPDQMAEKLRSLLHKYGARDFKIKIEEFQE
jgi:Amt family ammonium transporter